MQNSQDKKIVKKLNYYLLACNIAGLLEEHKGGDVVLLDLRELSLWTDFFIIATVSSGAHNEGLKKHIRDFAKKNSLEILNKKGTKSAGAFWDLLDAGSIVVHLMSQEARSFYELEKLWSGAKHVGRNEWAGRSGDARAAGGQDGISGGAQAAGRAGQSTGMRARLNEICNERIMVLDGAMGTLIQTYKLGEESFRGTEFADNPAKLSGCNDLLCVTYPELIIEIHTRYLRAGAEIIETCSFNSNAVSLADYNLSDWAYKLCLASAKVACQARDNFVKESGSDIPRFVAGGLGPLTKSGSISPSMEDSAARAITFDAMMDAYYESARGLLDGGVDIFLIETAFDTLNVKAAFAALEKLCNERDIVMPVMVSAAISDASGRLLAGQTVEALYASLMSFLPITPLTKARLWSIGLNCSLGARHLKQYIERFNALAPPLRISVYPNAGLPNENGAYNETPEMMAANLKEYVDEGLLNIAGGCCGSTPEHIAAISAMLQGRKPRPIPERAPKTYLSGLEPREIPERGLFIVSERANTAGNKKFLSFIKNKNYNEALKILKEDAARGAGALDIAIDDPLLDSEYELVHFLNLAGSDPAIAKLPFVIDSSSFNTLIAGLKCVQGRALANSISLKEGEAEFLRRAVLIRELGALPIVMLFDEAGQAVTEERKVEIASRAFRILSGSGWPPYEIIFDLNVLPVATGIKEDKTAALAFINAAKAICKKFPGVKIAGGISNLSFSFKGSRFLRDSISAVFIKNCPDLSIAITNIDVLDIYDKIEPELKTLIEDMLLCKSEDAEDKLLKYAGALRAENFQKAGAAGAITGAGAQGIDGAKETRADERVVNALVSGDDEGIEDDITALLGAGAAPLDIVENILMKGMNEVSEKFSSGEMFLPELIRSARVMKKAVAVLDNTMKSSAQTGTERAKIILATVKGDVHDIGKNIVATVLGCNGFEVIDLGVMVDKETIVERARETGADIIGVSGLVTPSLPEMEELAVLMEKEKMTLPLLVGGAALSLAWTALHLSGKYSAPVVYVANAAEAPVVARALLSDKQRGAFIEDLNARYDKIIAEHK